MGRQLLFLFCLALFIPYILNAQYFETPKLLVPYMENAPEIFSRSAVLIDASTGALLYSKNHDEEIPPASLTKLMTMHLLMNEIESGRASYEEIIPVTVESWAQSQPPRSSLMFLAPGQIVTLREIMLGLAVSSGNDAAVAAALRLAPSMGDFAQYMTTEARRMGLNVTRFVESSGISEYNITTAAEFAFFCRQYITLHPQSLKDFHSVRSFAYPKVYNVPAVYQNRPNTIEQFNSNSLIITFPGVDGLKTGYIDESGYNIALTAERDNTRFICVTLGAEDIKSRNIDGTSLLSWAFNNFKTVFPITGNMENIRLWKGRENNVELTLAQSTDFSSPVDRANTLLFETIFPQPLTAPLAEREPVGYFIINDEYGELHRVQLLTVRAYEKGNIFRRIWHTIVMLFQKLKSK
jgi:D-alanyl-D-alanine carboxypeptidase (penicillin-binding protein 5/6)